MPNSTKNIFSLQEGYFLLLGEMRVSPVEPLAFYSLSTFNENTFSDFKSSIESIF